MSTVFPFTAIVGQEAMKQALLIAAVDQDVGGVLVMGDRGTGKSTAIRALAALLPKIEVVKGCPYNTPPIPASMALCPHCSAQADTAHSSLTIPTPVVDLPLGATEDRVIGALDIEKALHGGEKAFEPGLLARAHRGFLYIDEVNLLEDHIVDLLLDVAASGENVVEREGLSIRHPARFVLVGSGNPEEGELRPQLLDRFGLSVDITTPQDVQSRVAIIRQRELFEADRDAFVKKAKRKENVLRKKIEEARARLPGLTVSTPTLELAATLCIALGTDGLRGELTLIKAARAFAALASADSVEPDHLRSIATMVLGHRLRRDPLDDASGSLRVQRKLEEMCPA